MVPWHWNSNFSNDLVFPMSKQTILIENSNPEFFEGCTHASTLRAQAIALPSDIEIQNFQLISFLYSQDFLSLHARKHIACTGYWNSIFFAHMRVIQEPQGGPRSPETGQWCIRRNTGYLNQNVVFRTKSGAKRWQKCKKLRNVKMKIGSYSNYSSPMMITIIPGGKNLKTHQNNQI